MGCLHPGSQVSTKDVIASKTHGPRTDLRVVYRPRKPVVIVSGSDSFECFASSNCIKQSAEDELQIPAWKVRTREATYKVLDTFVLS